MTGPLRAIVLEAPPGSRDWRRFGEDSDGIWFSGAQAWVEGAQDVSGGGRTAADANGTQPKGKKAVFDNRSQGDFRVHISGARGFTLLEVTIAMAILALAVASIFDLLKAGLLTTEASESYS